MECASACVHDAMQARRHPHSVKLRIPRYHYLVEGESRHREEGSSPEVPSNDGADTRRLHRRVRKHKAEEV